MDGFSTTTFSEYAVPHKDLDINGLCEVYGHRKFCNKRSIVPKYLTAVK